MYLPYILSQTVHEKSPKILNICDNHAQQSSDVRLGCRLLSSIIHFKIL
jgi:hypothetical protein